MNEYIRLIEILDHSRMLKAYTIVTINECWNSFANKYALPFDLVLLRGFRIHRFENKFVIVTEE